MCIPYTSVTNTLIKWYKNGGGNTEINTLALIY